MDEHNLRQLFQDAPGQAPPPGFGIGDVTSASQRATARHRIRMATASTAAVLVLAGGGLFAVLGPFSSGGDDGNSGTVGNDVAAAAPEAELQRKGQPFSTEGRPQDGGSEQDQGTAKQGVEPNQRSAPEAAGTARCRTVDRRLATALAGELPVDPSSPAISGQLPCDEYQEQAAFRVADGTVTVALVPAATNLSNATNGSGEVASALTADGRQLTVYSRGEGGKPNPYAGRLQQIADAIAAGL